MNTALDRAFFTPSKKRSILSNGVKLPVIQEFAKKHFQFFISTFIEAVAAGLGREQLRFGAGVFAAVQRSQRVDFAGAQALPIGTQEWAAFWQTAASATSYAIAFAVFVNRQNARGRSFKFSRPRIFRKKLCSDVSHKYKT